MFHFFPQLAAVTILTNREFELVELRGGRFALVFVPTLDDIRETTCPESGTMDEDWLFSRLVLIDFQPIAPEDVGSIYFRDYARITPVITKLCKV